MHGKYAILIDGGFIKKKLKARTKHFPTVTENSMRCAKCTERLGALKANARSHDGDTSKWEWRSALVLER